MATVVTKEPPSRPCQFVAVWEYNNRWWSKTYQVLEDGSLHEWMDPGNDMRLEEVKWRWQPWINGDATEAFFVYEEE